MKKLIEELEMLTEKTERKKTKKSSFSGLKKGTDYIQLDSLGSGYNAVIPLDWKTSALLGSKRVNGVEGKWIISTKKGAFHWNINVGDQKLVPVFLLKDKEKYIMMFDGSSIDVIRDKVGRKLQLKSFLDDSGFGDAKLFKEFKSKNAGKIAKAKAEIDERTKGNHWFTKGIASGEIKVKDADYKLKSNGALIWKSGTWIKGTWGGGVWESGTWKDGLWEWGTWKDGTWEGGFWQGGTWEDGAWKDGTWKRGVWEGGSWEDGTWRDGRWEDGTWEDGTWKDGYWRDGTWKNGTFEDGRWYDGVWHNGTWKRGDWKKGTWKTGKNEYGHAKTDPPNEW